MFRSRVQGVMILLSMLAALVLFVACSSEETPVPEASPVVETSSEQEEAAAEPEEDVAPTEAPIDSVEEEAEPEEAEVEAEEPAPEPTAEPEPTPEPTATPVVVVDVDSACVSCHTDAERLKELAEEPEAVHLSSGEG